MKTGSQILAGLLCSALVSSVAHADLLCIKSVFKGGTKVGMKAKTVTTVKCPSGYTKIANTSLFTGPAGADGADGQLRIYGDGSAGAKTVSADETLGVDASPNDDANLQYTNVVIDAGKTLTVPSGTVIRCSGNFTNNGAIQVLAGAKGGSGAYFTSFNPLLSSYNFRDGQPHPGVSPGAAGNGPQAVNDGYTQGGAGGSSLSEFQARQIVRVGSVGGGGGGAGGYRVPGLAFFGGNSGGAGGGALTILCQGTVTNNGIISANGETLSGGGGAGGVIVLASKTAVTLSSASVIEAKGAAGVDGGVDAGPSGGGGGGIVHFIAPAVNAAAGSSVSVTGGAAGADVAVTDSIRFGGGGGGACGGSGGYGGSVDSGNPASAGNAAVGGDGLSITTQVDPTSVF